MFPKDFVSELCDDVARRILNSPHWMSILNPSLTREIKEEILSRTLFNALYDFEEDLIGRHGENQRFIQED